ncbi:esterase/lipase family protein [Desulfohalovibrio reitneri]|uniref:esterase/lipase family protein n=1 Tax=Desulfohalovibrio reitneri TaxID=1307759 RepID=UPI0004A6ECEC|nr:alpha/beta fold hydrolase [Desulfohalovibrio reitneri]
MWTLLTILAILAALLIAEALFVSTVTHALLWYEISGTEHARKLRSRGCLPLLFATGLLRAMGTQFLVVLTYHAHRLPWFGRERPDARGPVLICIHGLYHSPSAWVFHGPRFERAGFTDQVRIGYRCWFAPMNKAVEEVKRKVRRALDERPGRDALLVGHSLGGLMVRACLAEPDIAQRTRAAVSLGTPHRGSRLTAFGWGPITDTIRLDSPEIERFCPSRPAVKVPRLALATPMDNFVLPPRALLPPEGWEWAETGPINHIAMLHDRRTVEMVTDFLRRTISR